MVSPEVATRAGSTDRSWSFARLFMQNEIKFLHIFLIFYLCFGALIFEKLAIENCSIIKTSSNNNNNNHQDHSPTKNVTNRTLKPAADIRSDTAQRMWNITNQLNILYETNWTKLILAELNSFEAKLKREIEDSFLAKLEEGDDLFDAAHSGEFGENHDHSSAEIDNINHNDDYYSNNKSNNSNELNNSSDKQDERKQQQAKHKDQSNKHNSRFKSLKKWFSHSLATIAGFGFARENFAPKCKGPPDQFEDNPFVPDGLKVFTIFYGLMGMPIFIYSVCRIGDLLSLSTMNFQLRFVHYAIKLPFYLIRQLIRLMCCLCCCCYCCGLLAITTQSIFLIPCLRPERPELKLYKPLLKSSQESGKNSKKSQKKNRSKKHQADKKANEKLKQKSVRFSPIQRDSQEPKTQNDVIEIESDDEDDHGSLADHDIEWQRRLFRQASSGQLVIANLFLIIIYLLIGAFVHAKYKQQTFVLGLFSSYQLVTTSANQFPPQATQSTSSKFHNRNRQQHESRASSNDNGNQDRKQMIPMSLYDGDFFALFECLYLWIGLNLMSCFMQAVRVKFDCWRRLYVNIATSHDALANSDETNNEDYSGNKQIMQSSYANCNGHVPLQLMNPLQQQDQSDFLQPVELDQLKMITNTSNYLSEHSNNIPTSSADSNNNYHNNSIVQNNGSPGSSTLSYHPAIVQSSAVGQQPAVPSFNTGQLAELYVVDDNQYNQHLVTNHHQHYGPSSSFKTTNSNNSGHPRQRSMHGVNSQQPLASDISLSVSSAATTEKSSICLNHHQAGDEFEQAGTCRLIGPPSMRLVGQSPQQGHTFMLTDVSCYDQDEPRSANSRLVSSASSQSLSAHHIQKILNQNQDQQSQHTSPMSTTKNHEISTCAIHTLDRKTNKHNNNNQKYSAIHGLAGSTSTLHPRQTSLSNHKTFFNNTDQ